MKPEEKKEIKIQWDEIPDLLPEPRQTYQWKCRRCGFWNTERGKKEDHRIFTMTEQGLVMSGRCYRCSNFC